MNIVLILIIATVIILSLIAINYSITKIRNVLLIKSVDDLSIREAANRDDYVRINGAARKHNKILKSPINNRECFAYKYNISKKHKPVNISTNSDWKTIENEENAVDFIIEDKTGTAYIHTNNANISLTNDSVDIFSSLKSIPDIIKGNDKLPINLKKFNFNKKLKFKEDVLKSGENMFIIGKFNKNNLKTNETIEIDSNSKIFISDKRINEDRYSILLKSIIYFILGILSILTIVVLMILEFGLI